MTRRWRAIRTKVLPPIGYLLARILGSTLRIQSVGEDGRSVAGKGVIYAGWHGRTLIPALVFRNKGIWAIISRSRDGEMQNQIFRRFGFRTIRGSTGKNGARALAESIRVLKHGDTMALTPDGPRGPSEKVQPGIVMMAKRSGAALVPVGVSASKRWHVKTWDRYMVPWPFAKCVMVYGEPMFVSKDASEEESEEARRKLESAIVRVQLQADTYFERNS